MRGSVEVLQCGGVEIDCKMYSNSKISCPQRLGHLHSWSYSELDLIRTSEMRSKLALLCGTLEQLKKSLRNYSVIQISLYSLTFVVSISPRASMVFKLVHPKYPQ